MLAVRRHPTAPNAAAASFPGVTSVAAHSPAAAAADGAVEMGRNRRPSRSTMSLAGRLPRLKASFVVAGRPRWPNEPIFPDRLHCE